MKVQTVIAYSIFLLFLDACQSGPDRNQPTIADTVNTNGQQTQSGKKWLQFVRTKSAGKEDTLPFPLKKRSVVHIVLSVPQDSGNIRISHLIRPDGTTDGPFGRTYGDTLNIPGTYRIVVAEDRMQENAYTGDYKVSVHIAEE